MSTCIKLLQLHTSWYKLTWRGAIHPNQARADLYKLVANCYTSCYNLLQVDLGQRQVVTNRRCPSQLVCQLVTSCYNLIQIDLGQRQLVTTCYKSTHTLLQIDVGRVNLYVNL